MYALVGDQRADAPLGRLYGKGRRISGGETGRVFEKIEGLTAGGKVGLVESISLGALSRLVTPG